MILNIIGLCAATLTMFSFIPQIIKVMQHRSARDVSLIMLLQLCLGVSLWMVYGFAKRDFIIVLANSVTFITLLILLFLYHRYGREGAR